MATFKDMTRYFLEETADGWIAIDSKTGEPAIVDGIAIPAASSAEDLYDTVDLLNAIEMAPSPLTKRTGIHQL